MDEFVSVPFRVRVKRDNFAEWLCSYFLLLKDQELKANADAYIALIYIIQHMLCYKQCVEYLRANLLKKQRKAMNTIIRNAYIINEGEIQSQDLLICDERIEKIGQIDQNADIEIDADGLHLMPGIIDDQVHFREPGLTHKADIFTESRAAIVGGVTSFMEMPNTKPPAVTQERLQDKYDIAAMSSFANYSFFMGATNDNLEEVMRTNQEEVCGIKVFMGSSTGNMLVDQDAALHNLFSKCPMLIATHCEDEQTVRSNKEAFKEKYGDQLSAIHHPEIRSVEGCYLSSSKAVALAKKIWNQTAYFTYFDSERN